MTQDQDGKLLYCSWHISGYIPLASGGGKIEKEPPENDSEKGYRNRYKNKSQSCVQMGRIS